MKLSAELWREVEPLLSHALELGPDERGEWLERVEGTHPQAAPMLRRMLATHERAERARELETATLVASAALRHHMHAAGQAIGPFLLISPLGRGGMGEVWLARHADGHLERNVALKLPASHQQGEVARERFRRERDILARLEHPHIARLYDAGVTPQGQPWLAMELVEGVPIAQAARDLPLPGRLALFRQVLSAVALAHRHLVVHRDLKPANILVDASGQVKLLDFGIAKLIEAELAGDDLTRAGGRVMTLRYAAPEQVTSGEITTATDVYSLGVVLHELLAGVSPYRAVREGRPFTELDLLREEPGAPSRLGLPRPLARALEGDLDAIVLKAMRPEARERYASVEQLDADIAAHLGRRPVAARRGTWRYRAGRFALRHKLPIAAAAALLATLVAGTAMVERERRAALAEKARAERHFASVRELANTFIFDVHGEIEPLAGSVQARRTLVATATRYLDALAGESRGDPALSVELAGAYRRLAEISGDARGAHLGDPAAARRHARRAAELLDAARAVSPAELALLRERRVVGLLLGRLRLEGGDNGGVEDTAFAARIAEEAAGMAGATVNDRRDMGATLAEYGGILAVVRDDHAAAAAYLARAVEALEAVVREQPADVPSRASLAYAYERTAAVAEATGRPDELPRAVEMLEKSIAATESVVRDEPLRVFHAQKLGVRYNNSARVRLKAGDVQGARRRAEGAVLLVERLARADAANVSLATMRVATLAMWSHVEMAAGRHARAIELARASIAAHAGLPAEVRASLIVRDSVDDARRSLAASSCALAAQAGAAPRAAQMRREAHALFAESRAFKEELVARGIDARDAAAALREIEAQLARCPRPGDSPSPPSS